MSATISSDSVIAIFSAPKDGIIGVVDRLLELARGGSIRVEWRDECVWVHQPGAGVVTVPFRKLVFRAALDRVSILCDRYRKGSVSPYGGMGMLSLAGDPPTVFRIALMNTPDEQTLEVIDEQALQRFLAAPVGNGSPAPSRT